MLFFVFSAVLNLGLALLIPLVVASAEWVSVLSHTCLM